jgi:hypothetical protein
VSFGQPTRGTRGRRADVEALRPAAVTPARLLRILDVALWDFFSNSRSTPTQQVRAQAAMAAGEQLAAGTCSRRYPAEHPREHSWYAM